MDKRLRQRSWAELTSGEGEGPRPLSDRPGTRGPGEDCRHHHWTSTSRLWVACSSHGGDLGFPPSPHPGKVPQPPYLASQGCRGPSCPSQAPLSPCCTVQARRGRASEWRVGRCQQRSCGLSLNQGHTHTLTRRKQLVLPWAPQRPG